MSRKIYKARYNGSKKEVSIPGVYGKVFPKGKWIEVTYREYSLLKPEPKTRFDVYSRKKAKKD